MKEEIELAKQLLDEMAEACENEDVEAVSGKANIVKTLMDSIELSCVACVAYGLADDLEIEPIESCDPEEDFCELEDEEFEDEDNDESPKEAEE